MFNKTSQDVNVEIYKEQELITREIKNPREMFKVCHPSIVVLITPSKNLYKVCTECNNINPYEKIFTNFKTAEKYWLSIEYKKKKHSDKQ